MPPHEPISAFQTAALEAPAGRFRLSTAQKMRLSYGLTAFSAAVLIVVIAAEIAGV